MNETKAASNKRLERTRHERASLLRAYASRSSATLFVRFNQRGGADVMLKLLGCTLLIVVFSFSLVLAQTSSDIEARFGKPTNSYSVSEHVWMTPEFTADGQLCRARLYPKKFDASGDYVTSDLSLAEVEAIFDHLVPVMVRGEQKENYGLVGTSGMVFAAFGYETVRISFVSSQSSWSNVANKHEAKEFPGIRSAQIVTITWLHRPCSSN